MHVAEHGPAAGRPLLLLHGGGVGGWMWRPTIAALGDDIRVVVPDLPGHDRGADVDYLGHEATLPLLVEILEALPGPAAVAGFSLGAQLTVLLAARRPDLVDRVVVVSAQAMPTPLPGLVLALLGATAGLARQDWFARLQARQLFVPPELLDDYLRTSKAVSRETLLSAVGDNIRFTIPAGWAAFPGEALVVAGSREPGVVRASARTLHAELPGSALEILPGSGHGIPLQRPDWMARTLRRVAG